MFIYRYTLDTRTNAYRYYWIYHLSEFAFFVFILWFQILPRTTHRQSSVAADTPVAVVGKGPCEIDLYTDVLRIMKNSSVLIGGVLDNSSSSCLSSRVGWSCHLHQTWQRCLIFDNAHQWRFWGQAPQQCQVSMYMLASVFTLQSGDDYRGACSSSSRVQITGGGAAKQQSHAPALLSLSCPAHHRTGGGQI